MHPSDQQVEVLRATLEKIENIHRAQLNEAKPGTENDIGVVAYQQAPKQPADLFADYFKLHVGCFLEPYGVRVRKQVRSLSDSDLFAS